jgi:hypothetical protein
MMTFTVLTMAGFEHLKVLGLPILEVFGGE